MGQIFHEKIPFHIFYLIFGFGFVTVTDSSMADKTQKGAAAYHLIIHSTYNN